MFGSIFWERYQSFNILYKVVIFAIYIPLYNKAEIFK